MRRKKFLKQKVFLTFVSLIFCVAVGSLSLSSSVKGSCRIQDISLEKVENFTKVTLYADKPFEFVHSTLEKQDGKPYRVIIDCKDAIHNLPLHNFGNDLPSGAIKAIRTSQFQTEPEKIVRIVLDSDKPLIYKVIERGEGKRGAIAILAAKDPNFPFWTAVNTTKRLSRNKSASSFVEKASKEGSEVKSNTLLTSSENKNQFEPEQLENTREEGGEKKVTLEKPLCFVDAPDTENKSRVSIAEPKTENRDIEIKQKRVRKTGEEAVLATPVTSPEVLVNVDQKDKKLQPGQIQDKELRTDVRKDGPKGSTKHFDDKAYFQKEPSLAQKEDMSSSAGGGEKATKQPSEEDETDSVGVTTKKAKVALLSPEEKFTKEEVRSPESLVVVSKPEGGVVEVVPQRKTIYYHADGRRDPFVPLTERISIELGEIPLPKFETLKLVGVLKDEAGNRALLEDERGYGYIMENGDEIKNGYVVSVEDDRITFQIQEYGWSRTMTLELSK